jgi:MFS family permease
MVAVTNLVDAPFGVALAVYVKELLDRPEALGVLFGAHGATAVGGALVYGAVGYRLPRRAIYVAAFWFVSIPFAIMATTPPLPLAVLAMALMGCASGPINPILMTVFQERVPSELRGRVFGTVRAVAWSAMPLGVLAGGLLIEAIGVGPIFAVSAVCYFGASILLALAPALRGMDRRDATTAAW